MNKLDLYPDKEDDRKHSIIRIRFNGKNLTIREWSDITGLSDSCIRERHRKGRTPEQILTVPAQVKPKRWTREQIIEHLKKQRELK